MPPALQTPGKAYSNRASLQRRWRNTQLHMLRVNGCVYSFLAHAALAACIQRGKTVWTRYALALRFQRMCSTYLINIKIHTLVRVRHGVIHSLRLLFKLLSVSSCIYGWGW